MRKRNDPVPKPIEVKVIHATTGAAITSGVTAYHRAGGSRVEGTGTLEYSNDICRYTPVQSETDYEYYSIEFYHTSAVGNGPVANVTTCTEPLNESTGRLFGIREWPVYGEDELFAAEGDDHGYATWPSVMHDGTDWQLYYTCSDGSKNEIRRRTSNLGKVSWSGGTDCVAAGGSGEWDEGGVWCPNVWLEDGTYYMTYTGRNAAATTVAVGLATSSDGTTWEKEATNPVMSPTLAWEYGSCEATGIIKIDSTYYLYYTTLTNSSVWSTFPAFARKIGYATSTDLKTWVKGGDPVFGDADTSYDRQPYLGYYSPTVFKNSSSGAKYYYMICAVYGANYDNSRFELWECVEPTFPAATRRRVGVIMTTHEHSWPNREVDIVQIATDDIERDSWSTAGEIRMYFGASHEGARGVGLATQDDIYEALRWTPSIQDPVIDQVLAGNVNITTVTTIIESD